MVVVVVVVVVSMVTRRMSGSWYRQCVLTLCRDSTHSRGSSWIVSSLWCDSTRSCKAPLTRVYSTSGRANSSLQKARIYSPGIGMVAGLFGSMIGVGGGVIMNPMILNVCKTMPQRVITGTSLGAVLSTALASGTMFASSNCVDVPSAILIASSSMVMAPIGARLTARLNCSQLRKVLGYFLFAASPLVPLKALYSQESPEETRTRELPSDEKNTTGSHHNDTNPLHVLKEMPWHVIVQMTTIGGIAGLASGLLGIGGGTIVTPMLAITSQLDHSVILGTSLVSMVPPAAAGLVQHYRMGNVDWKLCLGLVLGTSVGGAAGSNIALQAPPGTLECLFSLGMIFLGRKTLASAK